MTIKYGFYDSLNGDRLYNAEDMSRLFDGIITDGVFASYGDAFVVSEVNGTMNVSVGSGRAWFNSTWTSNDAPVILTVEDSESVLNRIDIVVIEVDKNISVRTNSVRIIKGTPSSTPVPPTLSQSGSVYQYPLAHIYVGADVNEINASNITNKIGLTETPFVTGPLETIDANAFFAQWESEFNVWFENLQNQLDTNQATNLQNQINDINDVLASGVGSDWKTDDDLWSYSSADSPTGVISVAGDKTALIGKGTRVSYEQDHSMTLYWSFDASKTPEVGSFTVGDIGTPTYTSGKFSNALTLDGSTDALSVTDTANLKPTGSFTVGVWIKTSTNGVIFQSFSNASNVGGFLLQVAGNTISCTFGHNTSPTGYTVVPGKTTVTDSLWHYVVLTYRNNLAQIYLDGVLEISTYVPNIAYEATNYIRVGCRNASGTNINFFSGQIDDLFMINGYALDERSIYNQYIANAAQGTNAITIEKMGIITKVGAYSGNATLLTVYHGTDFMLANSTISNPKYSSVKVPYGFNPSPDKWSVVVRSAIDYAKTTATSNVWYGQTNIMDGSFTLPSISIPIGEWNVIFSCAISSTLNPATVLNIYGTLSTSGNSESDPDLTMSANNGGASGNMYVMQTGYKTKTLRLRSKTTYYPLVKSTLANAQLNVYGAAVSPMLIKAISAYL